MNIGWIYSMTAYHRKETGLPVNIWLDEAKEYLNGSYPKRIKFQIDYAKDVERETLASMTLDGNIIKDTYNFELSELNEKDIEMISNFVKNNAYALDKLADELIYSSDFDKVMIKGGEKATSEQIENQKIQVDEIIIENS